MKTNDRPRPLRWDVGTRPEGYTAAQLTEMGHGGCDRLVLVSIMDKADGGVSYGIVGMDGDPQKPMRDGELFKVFAHLADHLCQSKSLAEEERFIAERAISHARNLVLARRHVLPPLMAERMPEHVERTVRSDE